VLLVEPAFEKAGDSRPARAWCQQLLDMYRSWADKRHMQLTEIGNAPERALSWLLISGFGAHRLLAQEVGIHVLEADGDDKGHGRVAARVRLGVAPLGDVPADKLRSRLSEALARASHPHTVVRRYRREPSPLVRNMNGSWRTGKLDAVLRGDFDLIAASQS
jgi:ATP-dependent Clp protease ATP-binding subunit ClpC